jgi:hypothetical protein
MTVTGTLPFSIEVMISTDRSFSKKQAFWRWGLSALVDVNG